MYNNNKYGLQSTLKFIYKKFKESGFVVLILLSCLFFLYYFIVKFVSNFGAYYAANKEILDNLFTISNATLVSGFVGAISQFLEYNKVYQKALEEVLTSESYKKFIESNMVKFAYSKKILADQKNLEEIWKETTHTLFETEFQDEISKKFFNKIHEIIFYKKNISHYYFDSKIFYDISIDENDVLTIRQFSSYSIVRSSKKNEFDYEFSFSVNDEPETSVEIIQIRISNYDYNNSNFIKEEIIIDEETGKRYKSKKFDGKLKSSEKYDVHSEVILKQNYATDNEFRYIFERFTEDIYVELNNLSSEKIDIFFTTNDATQFKKIPTFENKYEYKGVILPGFGFKIFVNKK